MKQLLLIFVSLFFFIGCSKEPQVMFDGLPEEVLYLFMNNCKAKKSVDIYHTLCSAPQNIKDAKAFLESNFTPFMIYESDKEKESILTGYYEPELRGSLTQSELYKYPIY